VRGAAVSGRAAFWALQVVADHAPEPARVAFRAELRRMGLRAPGDPDAPAAAVSADTRPDLFAHAAATTLLPWLDGPTQALAVSAIATLTERPARRSRAHVAPGSGHTGERPGDAQEVPGK
jgi:hypothetical protein